MSNLVYLWDQTYLDAAMVSAVRLHYLDRTPHLEVFTDHDILYPSFYITLDDVPRDEAEAELYRATLDEQVKSLRHRVNTNR